MAGPRQFNAINGAELRTIILKEVAQDLDLDPRFQRDGGVTSLLVSWRLRVECFPNEPSQWAVQVSRQFKASATNPIPLTACKAKILETITENLTNDSRFALHLTYPKVTWDWNMPLEFTSVGGTQTVTALQPTAETTDPARLSPTGLVKQIDLRGVAPEQPTPVLFDASGNPTVSALQAQITHLQEQLREMAGPQGLDLLSPVAGVSRAESPHHDVPMHTGTGLPIEGGFEPSPGAAMAGSFGGGSAVGSLQGSEVMERVELGVSHPDLAHGGAGAPDALRRDANLPIPARQVTPSGMIVDLPAGSF